MTNLDSLLKSRDITLLTKAHIVKALVFPVVMYGCEVDHKEHWVPKYCCFHIVVLAKTLDSPVDCKEIKLVYPKGNQPWIFIRRTDAEAEAPIFGYPMWRAGSLEKSLMLGKIEGKRRRGQQRWEDSLVSLTQRTWVWANSGRQSRKGKPGVLEFMGLKESDMT